MGKNAYYMKSFCGLYLDVCEKKAKNNQSIIQWKPTGDRNQIWIIEQV